MSQTCALTVPPPMDSVLVLKSMPIVAVIPGSNSLSANLEKTARMKRLEPMVSAAKRVLGRTASVYGILFSSVWSDNPQVPRHSTHDFPTPEPPIKRICQKFQVCQSVSTFPATQQTDLEEEIKVAAFSHRCSGRKDKGRSGIDYEEGCGMFGAFFRSRSWLSPLISLRTVRSTLGARSVWFYYHKQTPCRRDQGRLLQKHQ